MNVNSKTTKVMDKRRRLLYDMEVNSKATTFKDKRHKSTHAVRYQDQL